MIRHLCFLYVYVITQVFMFIQTLFLIISENIFIRDILLLNCPKY